MGGRTHKPLVVFLKIYSMSGTLLDITPRLGRGRGRGRGSVFAGTATPAAACGIHVVVNMSRCDMEEILSQVLLREVALGVTRT